tara:strand:- start:1088 stop:1930 length:843 start_codon:yes stop_codon:yes gene_type:complete
MKNKIIYYYQTFTSLKPIIENDNYVSHIHLSSIHFGTNNNNPYIHLNDYPPSNKKFINVWQELQIAYDKGIKIILMVGGAGGAFNTLFSDFETYYKMLYDTIKAYPIIQGIDLDVEESVNLEEIIMLIKRIDIDFGNKFIISMAPIQSALELDFPGLGNFIYKDLLISEVGDRINYFNGQFYGSFDYESYKNVIDNGYSPDKIVIGMLSHQFNSNNLNIALEEIKKIKYNYPDFGGVFLWEYCNTPTKTSIDWAIQVYNSINSKSFCNILFSYLSKFNCL